MKRIHLCDVDLDAVGCRLLAAKLLAVTNEGSKLVELDLSSNMIGDVGVNFLAPCLIEIKSVGLRHIGLSDTGCEALARYSSAKPPGQFIWENMDLYGNRIQLCGTLAILKDRCRDLNALGNPIPARSLFELVNRSAHPSLSSHSTDEEFDSDIEERIKNALESEAITLISAEWLIKFARFGRPIPYRQKLVQEDGSTVSYHALKAMNPRFCCRKIVVLSHMWLSAEHPDPLCTTLQLVVKALSHLMEEFRGNFGVFWDYASLHQHRGRSREDRRSDAETEKFEKGLDVIPSLFMCPDTLVFQVTELPDIAGFEMSGQSAVRYEQRGWPFSEQSWSSLAKRYSGGVFNLSKLGDGSCYGDLYRRCAVRSRHVPLLPAAFNVKANSLKFGKRRDRKRVKRLYVDCFKNSFTKVRELNYSNAVELLRLIDTVTKPPDLEGLDLERLNVSSNQLSARFCVQLNGVLQAQSLPKLMELDLSDNPIGNNGVALLASSMTFLEIVHIRNVGLDEQGCRLLHARVSEYIVNGLKVVQLNLSHNAIGDVGIEIISNLFPAIKCLSLRHVGCSHVGCNALAEAVSENLENLDLYGNRISTCSSLLRLVDGHSSSLKMLNIGGNPIRGRSLRELVSKCSSKTIAVSCDKKRLRLSSETTRDEQVAMAPCVLCCRPRVFASL